MLKKWICSVAWISQGLPEPLTRVRIPADPSLSYLLICHYKNNLTAIEPGLDIFDTNNVSIIIWFNNIDMINYEIK